MHPMAHAQTRPDHPAVIMASSGTVITYRELDDRSNQVGHLFRAQGLARGDTVALFLENDPAYCEIVWGAQRAGLYFAAVAAKLTADELRYILVDSGARLVLASAPLAEIAEAAVRGIDGIVLLIASRSGDGSFDRLREAQSSKPIADEAPGSDMLYSSGTTGRPKGIRPPLSTGAVDEATRMMRHGEIRYGMGADTVFLSPAPLYHAAPLRWVMTVQRLGGTVIVPDGFDAEDTLRLIERYRVTHAQFVPTHFSRLLRLPEDTRNAYDFRSLRAVFHAGAPCPAAVKEAMLAWWGPIVHEYYSGSEGNGITVASAEEWIAHKGTVGRAFGCRVHILDDQQQPLPTGEEGLIYFEGGPAFAYHNDAERTAAAHTPAGWSTLGDVGRLDPEGFLYLTDRKSFMIISGGVNVYPQEIENVLIEHPAVADAAVIGVPDDDFGERVAAVIQPAEGSTPDGALAQALLDYARARLSPVKAPKQIDFLSELPRSPTGKLLKRLVRDAYWGKNAEIADRIVPGVSRNRKGAA